MSQHVEPKVVIVARSAIEAGRWARARGLANREWEFPPLWAIFHRWRGVDLVLLPSMWDRADAELVADYVEGELRKRGRVGLARYPVAH